MRGLGPIVRGPLIYLTPWIPLIAQEGVVGEIVPLNPSGIWKPKEVLKIYLFGTQHGKKSKSICQGSNSTKKTKGYNFGKTVPFSDLCTVCIALKKVILAINSYF